MNFDLTGELIKDYHYYSKDILALYMKQPWKRLEFLPNYRGEQELETNVFHNGEKEQITDVKCFYLIGKGGQMSQFTNDYEYWYSGVTEYSLYNRLRRFGEELCRLHNLTAKHNIYGVGHCGGKKAAEAGETFWDLRVKYVPFDTLTEEIPHDILKNIDEFLAGYLDTKYNSRKLKK